MNEIFTVPHFHKATTAGDHVWVVQRDECGYPMDISGFMFLAKTGKAVLACSFINGMTEGEETLDYLIEETDTGDLFGEIGVFRAEDCYPTRDAALEAMENERREWRSSNG